MSNNINSCCACNNGNCQKCACKRSGLPCTNCNSPGCCNGGAAGPTAGQNNSNLNNPRGGIAAQSDDGISFQEQALSLLCIAIMTVIGVALLGPTFVLVGVACLVIWLCCLASGFGDDKP